MYVPTYRAGICGNCDWLCERNARLMVTLRRTAAVAHLAGSHPRRAWDACNLDPCVGVKKQLDALQLSRYEEQLARQTQGP